VSASFDDPGSVATWVAVRLDEDGILYALGGALALGAHGIPRMTDDVDFAVFVAEDGVERLLDSLERAGCRFDRARALAEARRIHLFHGRCGHVGVDFFISFHPHHHESVTRRVVLPAADGSPRWFLSAEDLAIHKLALFRPKDLADLERLFAARGPDLDAAYVTRWIEAICDPGDPRRDALSDLLTRFAR
jgi:hypothetical protein